MSDLSFVPRQNEDFVASTFKIIRSGEPGTILVPPNTHKSASLYDYLIASNKTDFNLIHVDLTQNEIEDAEDIHLLIQKKFGKSTKKTGVLVMNTQNVILEKKFNLLNGLILIQKQNPNIRFVFYFNIDITHPDVAKYIKSSFFSNMIFYPYYDFEDTLAFVQYICKQWKCDLKSAEMDELAKQSQGYFWLVKQAARALRDSPDMSYTELINVDGVRLALEQLYVSLFEEEKNVLRHIMLNSPLSSDTEKHSLNYLTKIGLVKNNEITIPLFAAYIREYLPYLNIELQDNHIFINNVNVDNHFSQKERRVFKVLLQKKGEIVSRDDLAKAIWPVNTDDYYSDWAVDRIMARLREKIKELGFSKDIVKTERNKGYLFRT